MAGAVPPGASPARVLVLLSVQRAEPEGPYAAGARQVAPGRPLVGSHEAVGEPLDEAQRAAAAHAALRAQAGLEAAAAHRAAGRDVPVARLSEARLSELPSIGGRVRLRLQAPVRLAQRR